MEGKSALAGKDTVIDAASEGLDEYASLNPWDWALPKPPETETIDGYLSKSVTVGLALMVPLLLLGNMLDLLLHIVDITNNALSDTTLSPAAQKGLFVWAPRDDAIAEEPMLLLDSQNVDRNFVHHCVIPTLILCCSLLQRGSVRGRQLIQNVVDLHSHLRSLLPYFKEFLD